MYGAVNYRKKLSYRNNREMIGIKWEVDKRKFEPNGAWVYRDGTKNTWVMERHSCIADAIKRALRLKGSQVILDGREVFFEKMDDDMVYYIDNRTKQFKIIYLKSNKANKYNSA